MSIKKLLLSLLILFLPTQLAYHYWPDWSLLFGIRIDYLSPTIYFTDILVMLLVAPFVFSNIQAFRDFLLKHRLQSVLLFAYLFLNVAGSLSPALSFYKWMRIFEYLLFCLFVFYNKSLVKTTLVRVLPVTLLWTCTLAFAQWLHHGSLNGLFYWLGERQFTVDTPGIALSKLFETVSLRPYATLPHPNALAGFVSVSWLLWLQCNKKRRWWLLPLSLIVLFTVLLTESFAVWIAAPASYILVKALPQNRLRLVVFLLLLVSIASPLFFEATHGIFPFLGENSSERIGLALVAGAMIAASPLIGIGLGAFVRELPSGVLLLPQTFRVALSGVLQPVHNVPLLLFAETGLLGVFLLHYLLSRRTLTIALLTVIIVSLVDHYWITLHQPLLLLALVVGLSVSTSKRVR